MFIKSKHQIVRMDMFIWDCSANFSLTGIQSSLNIVFPTTQDRICGYPSQTMTQICSMVQPELQKLYSCLYRGTLISCQLYVFSLGLHWRNLGYRGIEINHGHPMRSYPRYNGMGCDLVYVSHRDYKHDKFQWRYSFSRAEVTLIRSWTPIQQLVYHMLRYFAKQTIIREWKDDDKVVCTYHIKTLMLWACERKSPVWWESNCVIVLCSKLLGTLMKWIGKKMCPHYFIPEWNLFDYTMKESRRFETIEMLNIHTNIHVLSKWFRINYLSKVFRRMILFHRMNSKYQHALNVVAASYRSIKEFRTTLQEWVVERHNMISSYFYDMAIAMHFIPPYWNAKNLCMLIYSRNLAPELKCLNMAVASLCLAWNISRKRESELSNHELLDVLSEVVLKLSGHDTWNSSSPYNIPFKQCSKWYFIKGVRLLSIHCEGHSVAFCLWMKTCKRYFKSALSIKDEYSESIHDACHVYLAALCHVSGTKQEKTIKHILEAKNGTSSRSFLKPQITSCSTLLFVDTVAHVCGFCFLINHVLQNQDAVSENGFTLSAIVYCLILSNLRINNNSNSSIKIDRIYKTKLNFTARFDICLWAVSVHKYRRCTHTVNREIHEWSPNIPTIHRVMKMKGSSAWKNLWKKHLLKYPLNC